MLTGAWHPVAFTNHRHRRIRFVTKVTEESVIWGNVGPTPSPVAFLPLLPCFLNHSSFFQK